jgi:hypothetical protein
MGPANVQWPGCGAVEMLVEVLVHILFPSCVLLSAHYAMSCRGPIFGKP